MSVKMDGVGDYYDIADAASLTLPASNWSVGIWTRTTAFFQADFEYALSNNSWNVANSFNLYALCSGGADGKWQVIGRDGASNAFSFQSSTAPGDDGKDRLVVVTRVGATLTMYFCEPGQTAVSQGTASMSSVGVVNSPNPFNIGRRQDGVTSRYSSAALGEFFKGDFGLSLADVTALGAGMTPMAIGKIPDVYLPMLTNESVLYDLIGANDATKNGNPTTAEHFKVLHFPPKLRLVSAPVAAAGYTVTAEAGAVIITGSDAALDINRLVNAEAGAVVITGSDAALDINRLVNAEAGAVIITGSDAALSTAADVTLNAEAGAVVITGSDAGLIYAGSFAIIAESGVIAISGRSVGLEISRIIQTDSGLFSVVGNDAGLLKIYQIPADLGIYSINGIPANLISSLTPQYVSIISADQPINRSIIADQTINRTISTTGKLT